MEQNTILVSSRGLLKSCALHNNQPVSSSTAIDAGLIDSQEPGGTIYVCTDALPTFVDQLLPGLSVPFVLVSGDSDRPVMAPALDATTIEALLSSPYLLRWYAQNCGTDHPKLAPLPIGQDYHTMWQNPGFWGVSQVSPIAQERQLLDTFRGSPNVSQRYLGAYCNWTHAIERGDRRDCIERVDRSICFVERGHVPRAASWARQAEFFFVVSPEGVGMDCHRTWEAMALGCIPIVKRNALQGLFADLPVMIVEDWTEVRRDRLEACLQNFASRSFEYSTLFLDTWVRRIQGFAPNPELRLSIADFRAYVTRVTN